MYDGKDHQFFCFKLLICVPHSQVACKSLILTIATFYLEVTMFTMPIYTQFPIWFKLYFMHSLKLTASLLMTIAKVNMHAYNINI